MGFLTDWLEKRVEEAEMKTAVQKELEGAVFYKNMALYIAKSYIANTISKCEFKVYKDGKEQRDELYYALNVSPNPNQNSSRFLNKLINALYDHNEALVIQHKNNLYVADSFVVDEKPLSENIYSGICIDTEQINKKFKASDVFHFQLDEKSIKTLVDGMYEVYGGIVASAVASYKRGNGKKYKLLMDSIRAGDKDFVERYNTVIKEQLAAFMNSDNAVYPQFKGTDLQEFGTSGAQNSDDLVKIRKEVFEIVAQAFKIPLPMMYGNITNIDEIVNVFLTFCIDPLADMIGEEITRKTHTFEEWNSGKSFVRVDTTRINHFDLFKAAANADKLLSIGMLSIDELRVKCEEQPLGTEFASKHWVTKNYTDVENMQTEVEEVRE
jgi:HK97 family phage portal protein